MPSIEQAVARIAELETRATRINKLMHLLAHDVVFCGEGFCYDPSERGFQQPPRLQILCSDFFGPFADCETIDEHDIDAIFAIYQKWGLDGVMAWVSVNRRNDAGYWRKDKLGPRSQFDAACEALRTAKRNSHD